MNFHHVFFQGFNDIIRFTRKSRRSSVQCHRAIIDSKTATVKWLSVLRVEGKEPRNASWSAKPQPRALVITHRSWTPLLSA